MQHTNFVMLGLTGSGKTCYLLGMYKRMLAGIKGFTLTTDDDTDVDLRQRYARLNDASLGPDRFPRPTDQAEVLNFTLNYAYSSIMSFDWIDYPGGLLKEKGSGNSEQYAKLSSYVKDSGCLFICVDGELLQGYDDNEDKSELIQDNCSSLINPFLAAYLHENKYLPPTVIIVTKWDLCAEYVSDDDLAEIMKDAFSPLFVKKNDGNLFVTVLPVSLGANIAENNNCGRLAPRNIQIPIFMGIWFSLYELNFRLTDIIDFKERRIRFLEQKRSKEQKSFFLFRDDKKIASLTKNANNKKWEILKEKEQLEKAIKHSDLLLKQLQSKIKLAYYNGEEYESFSGAAIKYLERRQRQISSNPRLR